MNRRMFLGQAAMAYGAFLLHARAQGTSHAPALTIREIRAVRLRDGFNSRFIRVYTDQGLTGTGENIYSRYGFRPFLEKEALSVIQPDVSKTGGLLETRKIAAMAEVYSIPIAPHGVASPLGRMAAAPVAAATPNLMLLEFTHYVDQSYTSLTEPVSLDGEGFLQVRTTPGIGVALNEDVVKERTDPEFHPL